MRPVKTLTKPKSKPRGTEHPIAHLYPGDADKALCGKPRGNRMIRIDPSEVDRCVVCSTLLKQRRRAD